MRVVKDRYFVIRYSCIYIGRRRQLNLKVVQHETVSTSRRAETMVDGLPRARRFSHVKCLDLDFHMACRDGFAKPG